MNQITITEATAETLPSLVDRAARALAGARSSAEVLEARDLAGFAYDTAKRAARLAQAKGAHDALVAAAHRAQADALLIESNAKRRLADEYDAAQERGEVAAHGRNWDDAPTMADLNIPRRTLYDGREIAAAEERDPGVVERAVAAALEAGQEPTRALVKRAISPIEEMRRKGEQEEQEWIDKRDFRALRKAWKEASPGAQLMFLEFIRARAFA